MQTCIDVKVRVHDTGLIGSLVLLRLQTSFFSPLFRRNLLMKLPLKILWKVTTCIRVLTVGRKYGQKNGNVAGAIVSLTIVFCNVAMKM